MFGRDTKCFHVCVVLNDLLTCDSSILIIFLYNYDIYIIIIYTYQYYSNILPIPKKDHWNGELPYLKKRFYPLEVETTNHLWASVDHWFPHTHHLEHGLPVGLYSASKCASLFKAIKLDFHRRHDASPRWSRTNLGLKVLGATRRYWDFRIGS